ncbi:DUF3772 domain-containing protein [Methylomonas methanica]|uniref:MscS Mechanosensitive ion channel n=1 Tax=Methylomonas methanica (strain DSM 25384 / MC09) TaxID=857087 RepID=F9ZZZ2_METMM|nr:DUF3772 domain-containing protein [Methylomonas methanica]AEF99960.1 MscS Mechanosensitive ion channel [Methylomonas methanica MC09]
MKTSLIRVYLFVLLSVCSGLLYAAAEQAAAIAQSLKQWNAELEQAAQTLANKDIDDGELKQLSEQLNGLRTDALAVSDDLAAQITPLQTELAALGPPPAKGAPKEPASLAAKRTSLNEQLAAIDGQTKELGLVISRTDDMLDQLSELRIRRFTQKIFTRGVSPLAPQIWQKGLPELQEKFASLNQQGTAWLAGETRETLTAELIHLTATLFVALAIVWPLSGWLSRKFGCTSAVQIPTYVELLRAALTVGFIRLLLPTSVTIAVYLVLAHDMLWTDAEQGVALCVLKALFMIILVSATSVAILAPSNGRWRLMPLNDNDARYVHKIILGLAWVFACDLVLDNWLSGVSMELTLLRKFWVGLLIAGLLLALLIRPQLWRMDIQHRRKISDKAGIWRAIRALMGILVLMIPVSAIAGYVALSRLLGTQIVLTGSLYILTSVVVALCNELIEEALNKETELGKKIRHHLELTEDGGELLLFWLKAAVNTVIYVGAILALLVIWGAGGEDISVWLYSVFFGFNIGGVTVSLSTLLIAITLFSAVLLLTRLCQRFLQQTFFPRTRIDLGIQHSIRASVGYIGFIIAAGLAVSTLGIDLSKLAIIAGALSVGIGFGLQNVVNNFVSGLILLIERPLKVGDWVVVNDKQGYVKNINVRATEIQTFDRAAVFIPNSTLISNPLLNWTHADKTGRVVLPVGVAYGSDTRKVEKILLEVADAHPAVMTVLAPSVLFKGFGDSSLNFELRAFVQDVDKVMKVSSDLCYEIDAAFKRENIEMPFPQQDVHWKDMARLETLVAKILQDKQVGQNDIQR